MKVENTLPRYITLSYKAKDGFVKVEFEPKENEISDADYAGLKDTPAYKGYVSRGDFKEVKAVAEKPASKKKTQSEDK